MENYHNLIQILSAALTPVVAIAAVAIALMQWRINKMRHRHEMFDRRFEIYKTVHRCPSFILAHGNIMKSPSAREGDNNEGDFDLEGELADAGQKAHFLKGKEMSDYILDIRKHAIQLTMVNISENRSENAQKLPTNLNGLSASCQS